MCAIPTACDRVGSDGDNRRYPEAIYAPGSPFITRRPCMKDGGSGELDSDEQVARTTGWQLLRAKLAVRKVPKSPHKK
jgi:hypothetical protein